MHGVDDNIAKSRRMLSNMSQRFERHKYMMAGIIAVLLFAILFIVYVKSRSKWFLHYHSAPKDVVYSEALEETYRSVWDTIMLKLKIWDF